MQVAAAEASGAAARTRHHDRAARGCRNSSFDAGDEPTVKRSTVLEQHNVKQRFMLSGREQDLTCVPGAQSGRQLPALE